VIDKTLGLLHDMSCGYRSSRFVAKLDLIGQFLTHHTSQFFPFLDYESNARKRKIYYISLTRLLYIDEKSIFQTPKVPYCLDIQAKFDQFMEPFTKILTAFLDPNTVYRSDTCKVKYQHAKLIFLLGNADSSHA
jgi:exportin-7